MRKPLLQNREPVKNPSGLRDSKEVKLQGFWWLVMPETARDVEFLQILGEHERYANFSGEGILVSDNAIPKQQIQ